MARVLLNDIEKYYGDVAAVRDFSLEIRDKEFIVVVGPSGCGKSTTLRMVAGLEEITRGTITIGERVVNDVPPKDRDIAMVFQNYALYPHMTVYENMAFGLRLRRYPKTEIAERVQAASEILGIEELLQRKPKQLSGGQRQRVAVGRAIVRRPAVFLFDEPLSNLDAKLRVQMRAEISRLHAHLQTTAMYVTHDQVEAMTMGDRIVIMKDGWLQQVGTPLEVYDTPTNKFVAGFIGSPAMNFFQAGLVAESGHLWIEDKALRLPVPPALRERLETHAGRRLTFGIRPEDLEDSVLRPGEDPAATVEMKVEVVEPMGAETYVHGLISGSPVVARVLPQTGAKVGQPIRLSVATDKLHAFDPETEEALLR